MLRRFLGTSLNVLRRTGFRYYQRHKLQFFLTLSGIATGVAVVTAIDLAQSSASQAFKLSLDMVSGRADYRLTCGSYCPDEIFFTLRKKLPGIKAAPVIDHYAVIKSDDGSQTATVRVLGVAPLYENAFRDYTRNTDRTGETTGGPALLSGNGMRAIVSADIKKQFATDSELLLQRAGREYNLQIAGSLQQKEGSVDSLLVVDIATAQYLFNYTGERSGFSRIDLIIDNEKQLADVKNLFGDQINLEAKGSAADGARIMTAAFNLNLTAMSLLTLIVGAFLVFNSVAFSIVQRGREFSILRTLGVTVSELKKQIITEAMITGLLGSIIGLGLGILLATFLLDFILMTINNLYFTTNLNTLFLSPLSLLKGLIAGLAATFIASWLPSREITRYSPNVTLRQSQIEESAGGRSRPMLLTGLLTLSLAATLLFIPTKSIIIGFASVFLVIAGFTLLTPAFSGRMVGMLSKILTASHKWLILKMAIRGISRRMSRSALAIASLSVAVSVTIGVGTMVDSFRSTVTGWLESRLSADIYISLPAETRKVQNNTLPYSLTEKLPELAQVKSINYFRDIETEVQLPAGQKNKNLNLTLRAVMPSETSRRHFDLVESAGTEKQAMNSFDEGEGCFISQSSAFKYDLKPGETVSIMTDNGYRDFIIKGIFADYSSTLGVAAIHYNAYRKYFTDTGLSGISLNLKKGADADTIRNEIRALAPDLSLMIMQGGKLFENSMQIFDDTFKITSVLQIIAVIVSFIGVFSALMGIQLERKKELSVLRAIGFTPFQIQSEMISQSVIAGFIAGIFSIPLGNIMSWILINIINKRSFGWSFEYNFTLEHNLAAVAIAVTAAVLAAIHPALKAGHSRPADALRED